MPPPPPKTVPKITYPAELPIVARRDDLLAAIEANQVVVVAGETGSGKSTQLPKLCMELGRGAERLIGHTQPRRIAARTIAERVAEELRVEVGGAVGYAVRFTDRVGPQTLLKVMTDGILLAEIQRSRKLNRYDTLIIDEAHERSLNIDFLLGYLKQLLPRRPDLKLVITSATIDTERFSQHFDGAPVVEVSGRSYPVETRYRPIGEEADDDRDQVAAIADAVQELQGEGPGDVLVFLSGEREIRDTADALARLDLKQTEILPLYARLSSAEQHRVFAPHTGRRIVLATNVAETSLTVPGITSVVDPGTARISRYNRRTKVQRLPIEAISQASANQRAGRCGRVAPGTCIRLYSEADFEGRPEFTEPEILRTNLASVILQMATLGLGDIAAFPFVDPPDKRNINDGILLLEELGAITPAPARSAAEPDVGPRLTPLGRRLARLPVDPRLGRMVLAAEEQGCVREVLVIAAALSIQDPRERPTGKEQAAAELHRRFADADSDFVAYLNLWDHLRERQRELSSNQFRKLCRAEHLNYLRVREWQDVHGQLRDVAKQLDLTLGPSRGPGDRAHPDAIHTALLSGLLSHIGAWDPKREDYTGARNAHFSIAPGSGLAKKHPKWVVAAELVETNRLWARTVARVQPDRIEKIAAHLVTRSHGEPWWDAEQGAALVLERVMLYGLPIVAGRRAQYARVDPAGARRMFIQHALVEGDWTTHHDFAHANHELVEEVRALEERGRRRDLLVPDHVLFAFFDKRIPDHVVTVRHFDKWWRDERRRRPDELSYTRELLMDPAAAEVSAEAFPERWTTGGHDLELTYVLDPSSPEDGVTVEIPWHALLDVDADEFDWLVPGMREELVLWLVRELPKHVRRRFVPARDTAAAIVAGGAEGPLLETVAARLSELGHVTVDPMSWAIDDIPRHLRMTFKVLGEQGEIVAITKDLRPLQAEQDFRVREAEALAQPSLETSGHTAWDFGALPDSVDTFRDGKEITVFPALVEEPGPRVGVRTFDDARDAAAAHRAGVRLLVALALAPLDADAPALVEDARTAAVDAVLDEVGTLPRDTDAFGALVTTARSWVPELEAHALDAARSILDAADEADLAIEILDERDDPAFDETVDDLRSHLARLVAPGFVAATGVSRLPDVVRYVRAITARAERAPDAPTRDRQLQRQVTQLEEQYARVARYDAAGEVRWLLEDLRVTLFAPELAAGRKVDEQGVRKALTRLVPKR